MDIMASLCPVDTHVLHVPLWEQGSFLDLRVRAHSQGRGVGNTRILLLPFGALGSFLVQV